MKKTELVRPSHMLPGLLRSKATNVVICSIFTCKRQVSSHPQPTFAWPPRSQQLPGAILHKAVSGCWRDTQKQAGHLAVRASALTILQRRTIRCVYQVKVGIGQRNSCLQAEVHDQTPLIKGKQGQSNLTSTGQHYHDEFLYDAFVWPQFCRPQTHVSILYVQIRDFGSL